MEQEIFNIKYIFYKNNGLKLLYCVCIVFFILFLKSNEADLSLLFIFSMVIVKKKNMIVFIIVFKILSVPWRKKTFMHN